MLFQFSFWKVFGLRVVERFHSWSMLGSLSDFLAYSLKLLDSMPHGFCHWLSMYRFYPAYPFCSFSAGSVCRNDDAWHHRAKFHRSCHSCFNITFGCDFSGRFFWSHLEHHEVHFGFFGCYRVHCPFSATQGSDEQLVDSGQLGTAQRGPCAGANPPFEYFSECFEQASAHFRGSLSECGLGLYPLSSSVCAEATWRPSIRPTWWNPPSSGNLFNA